MGYLYLTVALLAGITKGFCGKKVSNNVESLSECIFVNLLRTFFCALIGFAAVQTIGTGIYINDFGREMPIYILSAVSMSIFCVCWMYAYKNEAYIFLSIFTMLGTIVTCFLTLIVYDEKISGSQWIGMLIILCAVFIMSKYNKGIKGVLTPGNLGILVAGCLGSAIADFSQKRYVREIGNETMIFNFYTYLFAFLLLLVIYPFTKKRKDKGQNPAKNNQLIICFVMSAALYLNTAAKSVAATFLSSAQIYPVLQGGNLILSTVLAHILLKEKVNMKCIAGILCAFIGLIIMNM